MGLATVLSAGALTGCVANPGQFVTTAQEGSFLAVEDSSGATTFILDISSAACGDGEDNDRDELRDHGEDPECEGPSDANERIAGHQELRPATQPVQIDAAGTMTYEPSELFVSPQEFCLGFGDSGVWCLELTVRGIGPRQTGSLTADGVVLPLPVAIEIDALAGFDGLGDECEIGPIDGVFAANGYDLATGASRMEASGATVPAATNCGTWTDILSHYLQLPAQGRAVMQTTILNEDGEPVRFA